MTTKSNLKRIREILTNKDDEFEKIISEDDDRSSDEDYFTTESESDDTSTDEYISQDDDLSDSCVTNDNIHISIQPNIVEKGGIRWSIENNRKHGRFRATNIIKRKSGAITTVHTVVDAFKLFFINKILDTIVLHTNNYAKKYVEQQNQKRLNAGVHSLKCMQWKEVDRIELEAFLGLLIQAGVSRANHQSMDELWDIRKSCPLYHASMTLKRFQNLLRFIRFDDREKRDKSDRLAPVRHILELFIKQLSKHFIPSEYLTIDEQLVPFRGRCAFIQYMPTKPCKYGIKFWVLSDVECRYIISLEMYAGKVGNTIQRNLSRNVVLRLIDQLPNNIQQGRHVTYDRYFTDLKLADDLLERHMTSLGVVDHKRAFIPNELKVIRPNLYSSWFYFTDAHVILSYQAKQNKPPIILLSTLHEFAEVLDDDKKLPAIIHDYNQTKFGVDIIDQCINNYTVRRISKRWPMVVFYNLIDIAAINALALWICQKPDWQNKKKYIRRLFLEELAKSLTHAQLERRSQQSRLSSKVKLGLQSMGYQLKVEKSKDEECMSRSVKRRRCFICPTNQDRRIKQICDICKKNVCRSHSYTFKSIICHSCQENNSTTRN